MGAGVRSAARSVRGSGVSGYGRLVLVDGRGSYGRGACGEVEMRIHGGMLGLGQDTVDLSTLPLDGESSLPVDVSNISLSPDLSTLPLSSGANPTSGAYQPSVAILPTSTPSVPGLTPAQLSTLGIAAGGAVPTSMQAQGAAQVASSTVNSANSVN